MLPARLLAIALMIPCCGAFAVQTGIARASPIPHMSHPPVFFMRSGPGPDTVERAAAAAAYLLPALDGFNYGAYIYATIPPLGSAAYTVLPLVNAFNSLPFAGIILFIGLSTFTRNQGLSRFVRFNIQQALLLDIALLIPGFFGPIAKLVGPEMATLGSNTVFYAWVLVVAYSWFQIAQGKNPDQVPVLSEAATMQIGPM